MKPFTPAPALVLGLAWLVAVNLRTGFIGVGPVIPHLIADLGLSNTAASVLVAVPTAMMGLAAVPGGSLADRWGATRVIALGLAIVAVAGGLRSAATAFGPLVALTVLFGLGIGVTQPALPRLARAWFPNRLGTVTGIYGSGYVCGGIVGAALTGPVLLPLAHNSWRLPLAVWSAVALATGILWIVTMRPWRTDPSVTVRQVGQAVGTLVWSPWRQAGLWRIAVFFAAQGLAYYLLVAWLPSVYDDLGLAVEPTAALFTVFSLATLPAMLGFPVLSDRIGARRPAVLAVSVVFLVGVVGLVVAPLAEPWRWLWPALAGAGVGGAFALGLVLPVDVAPRGLTGAASGMVLGIGYAGSALGPVVAGAVRDATGSFGTALLLLPLVGLGMVGLALVVPELPRPGRAQVSQRVGEPPAGA